MYRYGDGVRIDKAKAVELYTKAAGRGHEGAQFNLGKMYFRGDGVAQDAPKARVRAREGGAWVQL